MTDAVVLPASALPPGDADYAARMIARVDGPVVAPVAAPVVEAPLLAGKYKTQADLEKGYLELQKRFSATPVPKAASVVAPVVKPPVVAKPAVAAPVVVPPVVDPNAPVVEVPPVVAAPEVAAAEEMVAAAGLDFTAMSTEFATNGVLSEETLTALEGGGIPRVMVDQFIAGQQAIADRGRTEIVSITGGEEGYGKLMTWASKSLDAPAIAAYNAAVNGSDMDATRLAVTGLKARMEASEGLEPSLVTADGTASADGYANVGELKAAMKDPRYNEPGSVGAAYRKSVENKLAVSTY